MNKTLLISLLAAIALLAASVHWFLLKPAAIIDPSPDMVACTMEALICPDGTGVGRSGPDCAFSPCPNLYSHTGKLVQDGSDFRLEMKAPSDLGGMDTYSMPVRFSRTSNALADFVGKSVVLRGSFATGNTLDVSAIEFAE
jgi:hypothetical protein